MFGVRLFNLALERWAVHAAALGLTLISAGCASQQSATQTAGLDGGTAQVVSAQREPSERAPADANEPWNPHYGWQPRTREFSPSHAPIPVERISGIPRYATMDPDTLIRHAVAAHEMRRQ